MRRLGKYETRTPFDFVSPLKLEECVSRLGSLQDLRNIDPWSPETRVRIHNIDDNTYAFTILEDQPAPIRIQGYLNRLDDEGTYVSGEAWARVFLQLFELVALFALIAALTLFVGLFVSVLFLPPYSAFLWYYWRGVQVERNRLMRVTRDTLSHR